MLATLEAPRRRPRGGRRAAGLEEAGAEPVPTSRVTVIGPEPFPDRGAAEAWLEGARSDAGRGEVDAAVSVVNRALHAHRAARADPRVRDIGAEQALAVRLGFGGGEAVAEGRFEKAWELPRRRHGPAARRSMQAPEERFAALLGGRDRVLACEELVLRARADVDRERTREAALQARVALESLLWELGDALGGERRSALEAARGPVAEAANAALRGPPSHRLAEAVRSAVGGMEAALRARGLGGA